jgi:hypothetical protein
MRRVHLRGRKNILKRRYCVRREALQTAGRALAQQLPYHQRWVESAHVNQNGVVEPGRFIRPCQVGAFPELAEIGAAAEKQVSKELFGNFLD